MGSSRRYARHRQALQTKGSLMTCAAFFDMDGTLLSHRTNSVPASARRALDELRARGITVGLATGRSFSELLDLPLDGLSFDVLLTLNGQLVVDGENHYLAGNPLIGTALEGVLALFEAHEVPTILVQLDRQYINFINDDVVSAQAAVHTPLPQVSTYTGGEVYQAMLFGSGEQLDAVAAKLPDCDITRWDGAAVDVNAPSDGGKADGIARWCAAQGVDIADVIAFGDAENDITMLRAAGTGVALGNATPEAKAAADYVTDDIDADGVWNALVHLGVIA